MNIAIIGYGKMGREIEKIATKRGHTIGLIIDLDNASDLTRENLKSIDVAIEFSSPQSALENIKICLRSDTPVVSGTTGWLEHWENITELCNERHGGLFYASNYSIGVNILFAINTKLAEIMNKFPSYDVAIEEIHHIHKLDAPSGTAITLAKEIIEKIDSKQSWSLVNKNDRDIFINARREGEVNGFHEIIYDSDIDTISISHSAKSRIGFATGAVLAGEFINGKEGVFGMKDMLNL